MESANESQKIKMEALDFDGPRQYRARLFILDIVSALGRSKLALTSVLMSSSMGSTITEENAIICQLINIASDNILKRYASVVNYLSS